MLPRRRYGIRAHCKIAGLQHARARTHKPTWPHTHNNRQPDTSCLATHKGPDTNSGTQSDIHLLWEAAQVKVFGFMTWLWQRFRRRDQSWRGWTTSSILA